MATFNTRVAMNAGGSLARSRSRTCSSNMALSSNGGPGSRIRIRSRPSYFPLSHWPGALPLGLGSTTAPSITSACWWEFGVMAQSDAEGFGDGLAGQVIFSGPESSHKDDDVGALQGVPGHRDQALAAVSDNGLEHDFHAQLIQALGEKQGIGVLAEGSKQLRADGDDLRVHG